MPGAFRRIAKLSFREWILLVRLSLFSLRVSSQLSYRTLPLVVDGLARRAQMGRWRWAWKSTRYYDTHQLAGLASLAARCSLRTGHCLVRSLLLFWLLRMRGQTVNLCVGMRKENATVRGHAWIEADGRVLVEEPELSERFVTVFRF